MASTSPNLPLLEGGTSSFDKTSSDPFLLRGGTFSAPLLNKEGLEVVFLLSLSHPLLFSPSERGRNSFFPLLDKEGLGEVFIPAFFKASLTTGKIFKTCSRAATSGTTPPYFLCISTCEETRLDKTLTLSPLPPTTEAAVSSQLVSIPKIFILTNL